MSMRCTWQSCLFGTLLMFSLVGSGLPSRAQEAGKEKEPPKERPPFTIDQVIHPLLKGMPKPEFRDEIVSIPMAISSKSELAQRHVLQGLAYIQAAWDFEAYRHFCEAVKSDPDCLMAYWGIALALAAPNHEFAHERMVAVERMLDLIGANAKAGPVKVVAVATPMEEGYARALAMLFALHAGKAVEAFKELSDRYPNNLQAKCLAIYLQRDGFDDFGAPNPGQEEAMRRMREVVDEHRDIVGVLTFWAMLHAEAPDAINVLRDEILPVARKIERKAPNFPPYQHLLGHFEWRCGNHHLAEKALLRASDLYAAHMKKHRQTHLECDGWLRCQLYLATTLHSRGKFDEAMKIALRLANLRVDGKRLGAAGANLVMWEARTLPARLYLARGWKGDFDLAIDTLPDKDHPELYPERTLSIFYLEALRQYLGLRRSLEKGEREKAHNYRVALSETLERMVAKRGIALKSSSVSEYVRAASAVEVYEAEARGLVALAGDATERKIARTWFKNAVEKQQRPSLLMPPVVVSPMEARLGNYYSRNGDPKRAAEAYQAALQRCPNDLESLKGYQQALLQVGQKKAAAQIGEIIAEVRAN